MAQGPQVPEDGQEMSTDEYTDVHTLLRETEASCA